MRDQTIRRTTQALFYLNTATWLVLGGVTLGNVDRSQEATPGMVMGAIAMLMFGNAAAMFVAGWGLGREQRLFYILALGVIAVNILLTFTDQVGLLDWITLGIDLVLLALLVYFRRVFGGKRG